jgi:dTDP-4-dehydrorhamnose reductase
VAMRPIFVAGRGGQLARCLQERAARRDLPIVAIGRPELDLEDAATTERALRSIEPSAIVNAAAYTAVDQAEVEPTRAHAVNCDGAMYLAAAAAKRGVPFVHISSDYVFDGRKSEPYREDDAPAPLNAYGRSKLEGEVAVCNAYPDALVIRTSWVYSAYGRNFVTTMLRLAPTRPSVRVVSDQLGSPTSAADLAAAILDIVRQLVASKGTGQAGIYHLGATGEATWYSFAAAIFDGWARRGRRVPKLEAISTKEYSTSARRPANSRLDSNKAERVFGVRLGRWQASLEECLTQLEAEGNF